MHQRIITPGRSTWTFSRPFIFTWLVAILMSHAALAATQVRTVGASGCDFGDLQAAVDYMSTLPSADDKILRIAYDMQYTNVALTIDDVSLTLAGGYASCASSEPTNFESNLFGTGAAPVLSVNSSGAQELVIERLRISQGNGTHGGGLSVNGPITVRVRDSDFFSNDAELGGAVSLDGGAGLEMENVSMTGNTAGDRGGAFWCFDGGWVHGLGGNVFEGNLADSLGGAGFLDGCTGLFEGAHAFTNNSAISGGAIVASSDLTLRSTAGGRITFTGNRGDLDVASFRYGGAIYSFGGHLTVLDVTFENNRLGEANQLACGGAVTTTSSETKLRIASTSADCDGNSCSIFDANRGDAGAAICIARAETAEIVRTRLVGHTAYDGLPASSVIDIGALSSVPETLIDGSILGDNSSSTVLRKVEAPGDLTIAYSTFAQNRNATTAIDVYAPEVGQSPGQTQLLSSILWEFPETDILSSDENVQTECLLLSETDTVPLPIFWIDSDPRFLSPGSKDYRLASSSPAIDFCPAGSYMALDRDIDHGRRGIDQAGTPNAGAGRVYDIGADEFNSDATLLEDGFESGDTSAWSETVG